MGGARTDGSWSDSRAAQAARPRPRARHPHSRAALAWHGPSRGGLRAVRLGEDAAVKLAIRRSLADDTEAAHQEDVAEAVALEEALTVSSREAALLEQRAQRAARDRRFDGGHHVARRGPLQVQWLLCVVARKLALSPMDSRVLRSCTCTPQLVRLTV